MDRLMTSLALQINEGLYLKNPDTSDLGKRIVGESIRMIDAIGFEKFTFRKLGLEIGSNESSIYRYFENKHKLLLYLASWYWGWLEYQFVFETHGVPDPEDKLRKGIQILTRPVKMDVQFSHIDEVMLNRIIINEFSKSFLTKEVDSENQQGYFSIYKRLVRRIAEMIAAIDPNYEYPSSLASSLLEGTLHQYFLRDHFPSLTDCDSGKDLSVYYTQLIFSAINTKTHG